MAETQKFDSETEEKLDEIQQKLGVGREKALQMAVAALHAQCTAYQEWLSDEDKAAFQDSRSG